MKTKTRRGKETNPMHGVQPDPKAHAQTTAAHDAQGAVHEYTRALRSAYRSVTELDTKELGAATTDRKARLGPALDAVMHAIRNVTEAESRAGLDSLRGLLSGFTTASAKQMPDGLRALNAVKEHLSAVPPDDFAGEDELRAATKLTQVIERSFRDTKAYAEEAYYLFARFELDRLADGQRRWMEYAFGRDPRKPL